MTEFKEEKIEANPNEHYRRLNAALNKTIQEFNGPPGPGAGVQGENEATHLDPAMRQGYPVPIDTQLVPQAESANVAEKPKNRSSREQQEPTAPK